ncbi:MAG: tetratricopeptide repeat protein [Nitrospirae bacterium]|nr:tetratricopeptide repeat protein [Nitrospirota bacterium]
MILEKIFLKRWILLIFIVSGLALYVTSLDNGFYYDDNHQIIENSFIRDVGSIPTFFYENTRNSRETAFGAGHYRPLLLSTFVLNYWIGRLNPIGYHLVNLAFHVGSSFLVFLIVSVMLRSNLPALVAGLVMLFHPVNAEVVNYVTARSSVMATFFYLLAFYAYLRYRPSNQDAASVKGGAEELQWRYLSWAAFLLGILTKEILITLPLMLILYEMIFIPSAGRDWKGLSRRMVPFFLISLCYLIVRKLVIGVVGPPVLIRDLITNLVLQVKALAITWQMLLFPVNLTLMHDIPEPNSFFERGVVGGVLLLTVLLAVMVWGLRSSNRNLKVMGFALAWFYITLLPTILLPLNASLQENRVYIAFLAFTALTALLFTCMERWQEGKLKMARWVLFAVVLVVYGAGIRERNRVWDSSINLWQDAVRKAPGFYQAHHSLGIAYKHIGWLDAAASELQMALKLNNDRPDLHNDMGGLYMHLKREDLAEKEYRDALSIDPLFERAHTSLGILYKRRGDMELARNEFETALRIYPYSEIALYNLSMIYQQEGSPDKALRLLSQVLERNPNLPRIQFLAGRLYKEHGDALASRQAFDYAVRLDPSLQRELEIPR